MQTEGWRRSAGKFGLRSGVSIPIHDAEGRRAMLSLVSSLQADLLCRVSGEVLRHSRLRRRPASCRGAVGASDRHRRPG
ncbi:autoinducer binding domain-containing protein [Citrifermentans bemidjiense]|uniref:autoinducer binding domain-containing protein n=1 Tax=Citrifermentans bemidjiense TaxID=225194 RepID=UPI00145E825F